MYATVVGNKSDADLPLVDSMEAQLSPNFSRTATISFSSFSIFSPVVNIGVSTNIGTSIVFILPTVTELLSLYLTQNNRNCNRHRFKRISTLCNDQHNTTCKLSHRHIYHVENKPTQRLSILPTSTDFISVRYLGSTPCASRSATILSRITFSLASSRISSSWMLGPAAGLIDAIFRCRCTSSICACRRDLKSDTFSCLARCSASSRSSSRLAYINWYITSSSACCLAAFCRSTLSAACLARESSSSFMSLLRFSASSFSRWRVRRSFSSAARRARNSSILP
mmetsp:Transcript_26572/g.36594  ORF Transcript_26572/g.36594 Transcript_26572/m.36594 type:complete len:282 (-) Transcript_26572:1045-1890(-)